MIRLRVAVLAVVFVGVSAAPAQAGGGGGIGHRDQALVERLDETLDQVRVRVGDPGVQAVLVRNGRLLWSAERGAAIREPYVPVDRRTFFPLGSFGKLMLAAYVMDSVEAGALNLDSPISRYVGDSVPGAEVVTPRMLLTHTAGYPDLYSSPELAPLFGPQYDPNREWTFAALKPGIHEPVNPGARWEYSNTGFVVLAHVLDAVTKQPLERAYRRFVRRVGPTGRDLTMRRSPRALRHFAHGYIPAGTGVTDTFVGAAGIPTDLYGRPWGDGAFAGTARGAAQFLDALFVRHRLLRHTSVRRLVEPTPQSLAAGPDGQMLSYGMGTASYSAAGRVWHGHDGSYVGFTAMGATDLERGVSIAVATNREIVGQQPAIAIWRAIAETHAAGEH